MIHFDLLVFNRKKGKGNATGSLTVPGSHTLLIWHERRLKSAKMKAVLVCNVGIGRIGSNDREA